jgi:anaerobic magnesium-protoporphyrin IX monomethyl ester cyclase
LIEDLDSLPPFPFHLFHEQRDKYNFSLISSRGCPFRCIFCSARSISGYKYRYRDPKKVIDEIDLLANKYGIRNITFHDDNFTFNKKRVEELCNLIIKKGLHRGIRFYCLTRSDSVNRGILEKMREAGFYGIYFGIETASNRLMKHIRKGETVEDNISAVKLAKEIGFRVRGAFILGFPTETRRETKQTIKLARNLPLDFVSFSLATPFPGTELYDIARAEGYYNFDFSKFNVLEGLSGKIPSYTPKGRTPEELMRLQKLAYFGFYFKPGRILNYLKMGLPELNLSSFSLLDRLRIGIKIAFKLLGKS